jgi:NAD(P)H-hydrate epimerase
LVIRQLLYYNRVRVAMSKLISTKDMRILEMNAEYFGLSNLQLMENAGCAVSREVEARFPQRKTRVVLFCGLGGNGGDGFVAARHLISLGYQVVVVLAGNATEIKHEATSVNWRILEPLLDSDDVFQVGDSSQVPDLKADVIVDALLGVGLQGIVRQPHHRLIEMINEMKAWRLAVDVPSGLDSESGEILGQAVKADMTVTFHKEKPGLQKNRDSIGDLVVTEIGIPVEFETFAGPGDIPSIVMKRPGDSHKGDFGKLLILGGSQTYSGAPSLVALAAMRTGVDVTYIASPEKTAYSISSMDPNLITLKLPGPYLSLKHVPKVINWLKRVDAFVIGPGLGTHDEMKKTIDQILVAAEDAEVPVVLDADGLKTFAETPRPLRVASVLTPHRGEYLMLTQKDLPSDVKTSVEKVKKTARKLNTVILLKGQTDIISDGERVKLNFSGNPGMTVGGTGDVLSGIVGGFLAQGIYPFRAATAAAFVNGVAGDFVKQEKGYHMLATDLLEWIPKIIDDPMNAQKVCRSGK